MAVAIVSETGMAIHIPFKAYIRGKISSNGIRNMTCRVKLRKMDLEAIPKDWNRLVVTTDSSTICKEFPKCSIRREIHEVW